VVMSRSLCDMYLILILLQIDSFCFFGVFPSRTYPTSECYRRQSVLGDSTVEYTSYSTLPSDRYRSSAPEGYYAPKRRDPTRQDSRILRISIS
jgi:hypothetical protein